MADKIHFATAPEDAIRAAIDRSGWVDEPVLAAGDLRQGKAPSMLQMVTGAALIEVLRPRRSKILPRHFVLAVTETKAVAFKALAISNDEDGPYEITVKSKAEASFDRSTIRMTDLTEGSGSKDGILEAGGERIPVTRPNLDRDPSTDALFELLSA
jgi:hypothetical protein